jgi:hypothetical protein
MTGETTDLELNETAIALKRLTVLFSPYVYDITNVKSINDYYYFSIITEILINVADLSQKLSKWGNRIDWTHYITPTEDYTDITDLINHFRNAACHVSTKKRLNDSGYLYVGNVMANLDYDGEITLEMGSSKLFVNRHLVAVYKEILKKLASYSELYEYPDFRTAITTAQALNAI